MLQTIFLTKRPLKNVNLRRIFAALMIMIVAFDHVLSVQAASPYAGSFAPWNFMNRASYADLPLSGAYFRSSSGKIPFIWAYQPSSSVSSLNPGRYKVKNYTAYLSAQLYAVPVTSYYEGQTTGTYVNDIYLTDANGDRLGTVFSATPTSQGSVLGTYYTQRYIDNIPAYKSGSSPVETSAKLSFYINLTGIEIDCSGILTGQYTLNFDITPSTGFSFWIFLDMSQFTLKPSNLQYIGTVTSNTADIADQLEKDREEDREDAGKVGSEAGSFVEQAMDLESKWAILWYPIKFTNSILDVFTGGSSSAVYTRAYGYISGYTYDEDSGMLQPVYSKVRVGSQGASITFPEFTLPYLDVKLWDSYEFDISSVKADFPVVFDAIYVVSSAIEVYAFVSFLRDKYEEVFGG